MQTEEYVIARGKGFLHLLLGNTLEEEIGQQGDASFSPLIAEATGMVFDELPSVQIPVAWEQLEQAIEGEWDRLLALYYVDGLRGEALIAQAFSEKEGEK